MERYTVTVDQASGIKNDPNDWSDHLLYFIDLLQCVMRVRVSMPTVRANSLTISSPTGWGRHRTSTHQVEGTLRIDWHRFLPLQRLQRIVLESRALELLIDGGVASLCR